MVQEESTQVRAVTPIRQWLHPNSHEPSKWRGSSICTTFSPVSTLQISLYGIDLVSYHNTFREGWSRALRMLCTVSWGRRRYFQLLPNMAWANASRSDGPCYFEDVPIFAFGHSVLLRCMSTWKFLLNALLSKVCRECIGEVFLTSI